MPELNLDRRRLLTAAAALTLTPAAALARTPEAMGRALAAAVNEPTALDAFLDGFVSQQALARRPAAWWRETLGAVRAATGGVDFLGVREGAAESLVRIRTRRQGLERDLVAVADRRAPGKVWTLFAIARPTPYDAAVLDRPVPRADLRAAIDRRVRFAADRDEFSGVVRVVAPDGRAVYQRAFGVADRQRGAAVAADDRFQIGSADKSFTAILIGRLIEARKLTLDTRLIEVLPLWENRAAAEAISIRHLLTHSAGLGDLWSRPGYDKLKPYARVAELLPSFWGADPAFAPGTRSAYSNEGFVALGAVVEAVTGETWYDQLRRRVYRPAGMARSGHFLARSDFDGKVVGYRYPDDDVLGLSARQPNHDFLGYRGNSCGGGYSTVGDMTAYLRALRGGKLLPKARADAMTAAAEGGLPDYGMGFQYVAVGGRTVRGHGGGGEKSGIDGDSWIVWETGWACSVLGNYDSPFASALSADLKVMLAAQA